MPNRRSFLLLLGVSLLAEQAWALPEQKSALEQDSAAARRFIEERQKELRASMSRAKDPKTDPDLLRIFDGMLDYEHFVRQTLGDNWSSLSEEQRNRFSSVLRQLIQGSYRRNLRQITGYEVKHTGESQATDGVLVATTASDPRKPRQDPIRIDYVVGKASQGWRVRDIVTAGVSLVQNYRRQFGRIIKKQGFDELLKKMEAQLEKQESGD